MRKYEMLLKTNAGDMETHIIRKYDLSETSLRVRHTLSTQPYVRKVMRVQQHLRHNSLSPFSRSRDSAVGIATGYGLDDRRDRVRVPVE
jgi:hypothetical protein